MIFSSLFYPLPLLIILYSPGNAQTLLTGFEKVKINKKNRSEFSYVIEHPQVKQARLEMYKPRKEKNELNNLLKDFNLYMLTRLVGSTNSHRDMNFRIPAEIHFNEKEIIWKINLYAFGNLEKIRNKKQVFENKSLVITDKTVRIDWGVDTWCTLEESGKIIGGFSIKSKPFQDSNFLKTAYYSIDAKNEQSFFKIKHPFDSLGEIAEFKDPDFGAIGLIQRTPMSFLFYADQKKLWIFFANRPVSCFKMETTQVDMLMDNGRSHYIVHQLPPELWIHQDAQQRDKAQIIRLTLFSRLMIWALTQYEFH